MFSTLLTVALFAAPAFAAFAINSPVLVQCGTAKISWEPAVAPYNLIVVPAATPCGDAIVEVGDFTKTAIEWVANIKAGTEVVLSLVDSTDKEAWSQKITVGPSSDTSCLKDAKLNSTSTSTTTTAPSTTTTTVPDLVGGAANAGNFGLGSGAVTARQASVPVLALAGFVAVFALL